MNKEFSKNQHKHSVWNNWLCGIYNKEYYHILLFVNYVLYISYQ